MVAALIRLVRRVTAIIIVALYFPTVTTAAADAPARESEAVLQAVRFDQHLDAPVDPALTFTNADGERVRLGEILGERPVILTLAYYECPMLCTLVMNGVVQALDNLPLVANKDFEWVVLSIDPDETPDLARKKKNTYAARYVHRGAEAGWHFLVGDQSDIRDLADAVGFRYVHDAATGQYAHPAGIVILTPDGRLSRYLFGSDFLPRDLRLALVEASDGHIGTPVDAVLLRCYRYDPSTGRYGFAILGAVRVLGVVCVVALLGLVSALLWREHRSGRRMRP